MAVSLCVYHSSPRLPWDKPHFFLLFMLWSILKEASINICHKIFTAVKQKLHIDTWMRLLQVAQPLSYPASQPLLAGSLPPHLCGPQQWRGISGSLPWTGMWRVSLLRTQCIIGGRIGRCVQDLTRSRSPCPLRLCFMVVGPRGWVGVSPKSPQPRPQSQKPREQVAMEKEGKSGCSEDQCFPQVMGEGGATGGLPGKQQCKASWCLSQLCGRQETSRAGVI